MADSAQHLQGQWVDLETRSIQPAEVTWQQGRIRSIRRLASAPPRFILPGFIDAHVHIESSLLTPREFARQAVTHGTLATVSDPHEIANVLGVAGVHYMLEDAARLPFPILFGVPSCVPATAFETAGAALDAVAVADLLDDPRLGYLSEMMNFPGVLGNDPEVGRKLLAARIRGKPVDGHAPGLRAEDARRYFAAGISTDHECVSLEEAREKAALGVKILIREGSAARNFEALWPLLLESPRSCMFCSDDLHPEEFQAGHINRLVARAVARGADLFDVLGAACARPREHYGLSLGRLIPGDSADLIEVEDLRDFRVTRAYLAGELVAEEGVSTWDFAEAPAMNQFVPYALSPSDFQAPHSQPRVRAIQALDGGLLTEEAIVALPPVEGNLVADPSRDLLKIAVVNRYAAAPPQVAIVRGFGLRRGALASSVAHDCHNIVAVGTSDAALCQAVLRVMENRGGLVAVDGAREVILPLPVAGLMSLKSFPNVAAEYTALNALAKELGTSLRAPFMTLSFLALLVIPKLKLSDRGLFDGERFEFVDVGIA